MADNFTGLIGNTIPETQQGVNPGIPDNLALIAAIVTLFLGGLIVVGALVMVWRRGVVQRFFRKVKQFFKSESVSFLLMNNECSNLVGKFAEEDLPKATSVIIIWTNGDDDIYAMSSENLNDANAVRMMVAMANKVSSENGN